MGVDGRVPQRVPPPHDPKEEAWAKRRRVIHADLFAKTWVRGGGGVPWRQLPKRKVAKTSESLLLQLLEEVLFPPRS